MKITVPSHIVLASVTNGWPIIPQTVAAQADDGTDLPPEKVWDVELTEIDFVGDYKMRSYRVEDNLMIWVRVSKFPAQNQASYVVFAQAPVRNPAKARLNRFLKALKALNIIDKEWRLVDDGTYWMSAELNADTGPRPDRVRSKWPWYHAGMPIVGSIYALP